MSSPIVSVIVPVYNREAILQRAVNSVLEQTFQDFELLLVDDHSSDGSMVVMQALAEREPRIKLMANNRAKGVSGARNTGLDHASGNYIAFLDSDDAWEPQCLARLMNGFLDAADAIDVVTAVRTPIEETSGRLLAPEYIDLTHCDASCHTEGVQQLLGDLFALSLSQRVITLCCALFRSKAIGALRFDEALYQNEDTLFNQEFLSSGARVAYLKQSLLRYYIHDSNTSMAAANGGGDLDLVKLERATLGRIQYLKRTIEKFELNSEERAKRKKEISHSYYWIIAQNCCVNNGRQSDFMMYTVKAVRNKPDIRIVLSAMKLLIRRKV